MSDQFTSIGTNLLIVLPGRTETTGVFPGTIEVGGEWGFREGAQVRDPDGHAVVLLPDGDGR